MTTRRRALSSPHLLGPAVLLSGLAATGCGTTFTVSKPQHTSVASYAIAAPVHSVVVMNDSGDIDLVAGGKRVTVRETRHYDVREPRLRRDVRDGVLTLSSDCDDCAFDVRVAVPDGTSVTVQTGSGNVEAHEIDVTSAELESRSGDVSARLLGHQRVVSAHTYSGNVTVSVPKGVYAVDAETMSGDVSVDGLVADARAARSIAASTMSGDVHVRAR